MVWYYNESLEMNLLKGNLERAKKYLRMGDMLIGSLFASDALLIANNYSNLSENHKALASYILLYTATFSTVAALYNLLKCRRLQKETRESINKLEKNLR